MTERYCCLVTERTVDKDERILKESAILTRAGMDVTLIGPSLEPRDVTVHEEGFYIRRVAATIRLTRYIPLKCLKLWMARNTIRVRLFKEMVKANADYYHAHAPAILILLAALVAGLLRSKYIFDFNDILVLNIAPSGVDYYEQDNAWGEELRTDELNRIEDTISLVPKDNVVSGILDIGCGDGRIINRLDDLYPRVVGIDTSITALGYTEANAIRASAAYLPFRDNSFDLVLSTEVLEHLPDMDYRRAVDEMARVANRYILVGVPWREQLCRSYSRCPRCRIKFHSAYHMRSFTASNVTSLFKPRYSLSELEQTGGVRRSYSRGLLWIKQNLGGIWTRTPTTVCPTCNSHLLPGGIGDSNSIANFCDRMTGKISKGSDEKSHIIALYQCTALI
jgi:SAM-dependent methyltransferase